jgi:hypothetical protein
LSQLTDVLSQLTDVLSQLTDVLSQIVDVNKMIFGFRMSDLGLKTVAFVFKPLYFSEFKEIIFSIDVKYSDENIVISYQI